MTEDRDALMADAVLGRDAKEFLGSDLGRYMVERAAREEEIAVEALASVWPWRRNRIADLQTKIWRARSFRGWLIELVNAGEQAEDQLESMAAEAEH